MPELSKHFIKTQQDGGPDISERPRINFIAGSGTVLQVTDNPTEDRVDVTIIDKDVASGLSAIQVIACAQRYALLVG